MTNVICFAQRASNSVDVLVSPLPSVCSVGKENDGNDLMYRRPEVRGRKSEYNEAGTHSNQRQDVVYGGTFSTLISQLSTTFLPWNISCWIPNFKIEFIFEQTR
ncbi:MAG: hypothetical protein MJB12_11000 [Firmicutes bacterium]|nr:hypothetical protein [Bacillota bacterium]